MQSLKDLMALRIEHCRRTGDRYSIAFSLFPIRDWAGNPVVGYKSLD